MTIIAIINILMLRSVSLIKRSRFSMISVDQSVDSESIERLMDGCDDEFIEKVGGRINIVIGPIEKSSDGVVVKVVRRRGRHYIYCFGPSTARCVARGLDSLRRYVYNAGKD